MTGGLLGRYVAEERDSGRKLAECYAHLCANTEPTTKTPSRGATPKGKARPKATKR